MSKPRFIIGVVILLLVCVVGGASYLYLQPDSSSSTGGGKAKTSSSEVTQIKCAGGSEKTELMADPEVTKVLADKYHLKLDFVPMGSYSQVQMSTDDIKKAGFNCLWPSSASAQRIFEADHRGQFSGYRAQTVLQSPEVVYSGPQATAALQRAKLVTKVDDHHEFDIKTFLLDHATKDTTWQKLKAGNLAGPVRIRSTDARSSNSGFTMMQLELTILATKDNTSSPTLAQSKAVLPQMRQLYETSGLQAASSENGFGQWLTQGGEYAARCSPGTRTRSSSWQPPTRTRRRSSRTSRCCTPARRSTQITLDTDGRKLINAMRDNEIQTIAWKKYGFRSTTNAGINTTSTIKDLPLASRVRTIPATNADVTSALLACLTDAKKCS
ncbi:hypothetical protein O6R08_07370 [Cutibacterium equinum]|uniref:Uncharacterized protein n=1 Tax=Cutibacterium equinum TaxID=3016342 RepID=A0ABY7QWG6_9ACTN|nr:hypothetical protein [Cutibacterium equinum]WCC79351.1 hypothetical protein O6R08_07370 [Cutibacterium equinum]